MRFRLKSRGTPLFTVWALNSKTNKWDCWGEVHSPEDYPDLLERINRGDFWHRFHKGEGQYTKIYYNKNGDYNTTPNRFNVL